MASDWKWTPLKQKEGRFQLDDRADDDYWGFFEPPERRCEAGEAVVYTYQILPPEEDDDDSNSGTGGSGGGLPDTDEDEDEDEDEENEDEDEENEDVGKDEDNNDDGPKNESQPAVEHPTPSTPPRISSFPIPTRSSTFNLPPKSTSENYAILSQSLIFDLIKRRELSLTPPGCLLALEFPTCNLGAAEKLLNSVAHHSAGFEDASSILPKNDTADSFFTGVRIHGRAATMDDRASSVLLVSLPLLGVTGLEKAWFLVFDNVAVATFLGGPTEYPSAYPGQTRDINGAFVFLVNCISAVLGRNSGSQEVEHRIRGCSANLRSIQPYLASDDVVEASELLPVQSYLDGLLTIADCFRLQLKVLRRLHSLLQSGVHKSAAKSTSRRKSPADESGSEHRPEFELRANSFAPPSSLRTSITIPCISEQREQMPDVLMALEYLVDQRVGFLNDIQETEGRLRPSYELLLELNSGRKRDLKKAGVLAGSTNGSQVSIHGSGGAAGGSSTGVPSLIPGNTGQPAYPPAPPRAGSTGSLTNSHTPSQTTAKLAPHGSASNTSFTAERPAPFTTEHSLLALVQSGANTASRLAFIREELSYQGELFSFFTLITTVFLPLNFFAAYFALDAFEPRIHSESDFWVITGIVTGLFSAMIALMIAFKRYHFWSLWMFALSLLLFPVCKVFRPQPKKREDGEIREEVQVDYGEAVTVKGTKITTKVASLQAEGKKSLRRTLEPNWVGEALQEVFKLKRLFPDRSSSVLPFSAAPNRLTMGTAAPAHTQSVTRRNTT